VTADGFVAREAWICFGGTTARCARRRRTSAFLPGWTPAHLELTDVKEGGVPVAALAGRSLFIANAVRESSRLASLRRRRCRAIPGRLSFHSRFGPLAWSTCGVSQAWWL